MDSNRRKLVLGSTAVPLILTVRPAAATARTSLTCLDKARNKPKPHYILHNHEDEWLRKRVDVWRLAKWNGKKWETLANRRFIRSTDGYTYWELDRDQPYSAQALPTSMRRGPDIKETKLEERRALAYISDDGEMRGYGWEPKGGTHCLKSCWSSLKPHGY